MKLLQCLVAVFILLFIVGRTARGADDHPPQFLSASAIFCESLVADYTAPMKGRHTFVPVKCVNRGYNDLSGEDQFLAWVKVDGNLYVACLTQEDDPVTQSKRVKKVGDTAGLHC